MSLFARLWQAHRGMVVAGGVLAVVLVAGAFIWPITDLIAAHDVGTITGPLRAGHLQDAREAVRTQLLTLSAGVFAAGALVYTARNFMLSRRTVELTEQGQVTDRYTKAIEQLGSDKLDVRIGGIYALERVAHDSPRDHPTVMEVLAAFIREHSREQWPPAPDELGAKAPERRTRPDVQAAVIVAVRRDTGRDRQPINLRFADLSRADLNGAELAGADLRGAELRGADLTGAKLAGANFRSASLARVDLSEVDLTGAELADASLVSARLFRTNLTSANLHGAELRGAILASAKLPDANLTDTNLYYANFYLADLTGADLSRADLANANLQGAILVRADFDSANLTDAMLIETDLCRAWLGKANLTRADLTAAKLSGAHLARANLTGADLSDSELGGADFTEAELYGARWPRDQAVPDGWQRGANGCLFHAQQPSTR